MSRSIALVIEDNDEISHLIRFLLERADFHVLVAADGRAAKELIGRISPPNLIMLDVMLPYADGFELLDWIRVRNGWNNVPIVMLTAKSRESDIVRALEHGANDYIIKPFQPNELLARVRRLTRKKVAS